MKRSIALMVLVVLGGAGTGIVAAESESESEPGPEPSPFPSFGFSLLDFDLTVAAPRVETAWLLLAQQHNMGPLADASAPPQLVPPSPLGITGLPETEQCVCERCPALYWDNYCPLCGRYVPGPERPVGLEISW